ncbi:hypothetical protein ACP70R_002486 [Stipagrostis hirtigluma subsp. patula]
MAELIPGQAIGLPISKGMACNVNLAPLEIFGKVSGTTEITIIDSRAKKAGSSKNPFFYYKGEVRSGDDASSPVEATILAFDTSEEEEIENLYCRLNLVSHPNIMRSLGYEVGKDDHQEYIFLAFPRFEETLAFFMDKSSKQGMTLGRFTVEFIGFIGCVVSALLELHDRGFYCPRLNGANIAIVKENDKASAKLLDFQVLDRGNEKAADSDWVRLGSMLRKTADDYGSYTPEIEDLCKGMRNGTLKGRDILKQSALLTVEKKFENILSLNTYSLTHCKQVSQLPSVIPKDNLHSKAEDNATVMEQLRSNYLDEANAIASFKNVLDSDVGWIARIPAWISTRMGELGFKVPKQDTLREFTWQIRCLIQHANKYPPPEAMTKISSWEIQFSEQKDLESEVRQSWPDLFLATQKFATALALKY